MCVFFLDDELGVARNAGAELGGQRDRLVEAVGVQRLRAAEHRRHGLDGRAHDVVVGVLLGEAPARGLAVRAQHQALGIARLELPHDLGPQQARGAHLGDLEVEVHADRPEERQARRKLIHAQALRERGAHVLLAIGQRQGEFERLVGACLLHVVARDGDRIKARHATRGVRNDVPHDAHRRRWRVDVGVAHHELFEDVVLDGPGEPVLGHALLFCRHDVAGEHRQHGAVHRHGDAHLVERYALEQELHVLDRIDGHTGLADVSGDAGMVAVVAAVRGEVERHAHALGAASQRLAIEGVRFLCGGKPGVLPDGPGPHGIHRRLGAAHERRETRQGVGVGQAAQVGRGVERLDDDAFGRGPAKGVEAAMRSLLSRSALPIGQNVHANVR